MPNKIKRRDFVSKQYISLYVSVVMIGRGAFTAAICCVLIRGGITCIQWIRSYLYPLKIFTIGLSKSGHPSFAGTCTSLQLLAFLVP
jgi:hypothetical protein